MRIGCGPSISVTFLEEHFLVCKGKRLFVFKAYYEFFYHENIIKQLRSVISTILLAASVSAHTFRIRAPLPVFLLKCVWDVSRLAALFCVGRGGCGYRACGVRSGFSGAFVASYRVMAEVKKHKYSKAKQQADKFKARSKIRVNLGIPQWRQLKLTKGIKSNVEWGCFLLDL